MAKPVEYDPSLITNLNAYNTWNVKTDFTKEFLQHLKKKQPDYLILDFFSDVYFGCIVLGDGQYLTHNKWKIAKTEYYKRLKSEDKLVTLSVWDNRDEYWSLWKPSVDRFFGFLQSEVPHCQVILNMARFIGYYWTYQNQKRSIHEYRKMKDGISKGYVIYENDLDIDEANRIWNEMDGYVLRNYRVHAIGMNKTYDSFEGHPWGVFYVHYTLDYYHHFLRELLRIDRENKRKRQDDMMKKWTEYLDILENQHLVQNFGIGFVKIEDRTVIFDGQPHLYHANEMTNLLEQGISAFRIHSDGRMITVCRDDHLMVFFVLMAIFFENLSDAFQKGCFSVPYEKFKRIYGRMFHDLFQMWCLIDRVQIQCVKDFFNKKYLPFANFIGRFETAYKKIKNNELSRKLLAFVEERKTFRHIRPDQTIGIYGAGELGRILLKLLNLQHYKVSCFIDNYYLKDTFEGLPVITTEGLINCNDLDVLVVTPVFDYTRIVHDLGKISWVKTWSLEEIIS
jgi:hypothetical protein